MLPDLLEKNLRVLICGTAVANYSAKVESYYAGVGNKFWCVLHEVGLTPVKLKSEDYRNLLKYGIGLTDLVKNKAGPDRGLSRDDFDIEGFEIKIQCYRPKAICFNGKKAAKVYLDKKDVEYGFQKKQIGTSRLFVAPSTSEAAKRWWNQKWWQELSNSIKN